MRKKLKELPSGAYFSLTLEGEKFAVKQSKMALPIIVTGPDYLLQVMAMNGQKFYVVRYRGRHQTKEVMLDDEQDVYYWFD